jgi:hypothetical protein
MKSFILTKFDYSDVLETYSKRYFSIILNTNIVTEYGNRFSPRDYNMPIQLYNCIYYRKLRHLISCIRDL